MMGEEWKERAACKGQYELMLEPMFHGRPKHAAVWPSPEALALCKTCPVKDACLEYAYLTNAEYDLYGGLTGRQRDKRRPVVVVPPLSQQDSVVKLFKAGYTREQIARQLRLGKSSVRKHLHHAGLTAYQSAPGKTSTEVRRLFAEGQSQQEISEALGIHRRTVKGHLDSAGLLPLAQ